MLKLNNLFVVNKNNILLYKELSTNPMFYKLTTDENNNTNYMIIDNRSSRQSLHTYYKLYTTHQNIFNEIFHISL